jgi:hypothetical protein
VIEEKDSKMSKKKFGREEGWRKGEDDAERERRG